MAFGKIQARDLDPSLDLAKQTTLTEVKSLVESTSSAVTSTAKETTLNGVKTTVDEIKETTTVVSTLAKESTLTEVKSIVEEIKENSSSGSGGTVVVPANVDTIRLALMSDDFVQNEWAFRQSNIGAIINDAFALSSEDLAGCVTVDDIAGSPTAIEAISENSYATYVCSKNDTLATALGMNTDEKVLAAGLGYLKYEVGDTVQLTYGGAKRSFIVARKDYMTQNKIVLISTDILENNVWDAGGKNNYSSSTLRTYLNSTMLKKFSAEIQAAMVTSPVPCHNGNKATTCNDKIWIPSCTEVGFSGSYMPTEGQSLSAYKDGGLLTKDAVWWLRTPGTSGTSFAWSVTAKATASMYGVTSSNGVVCAFEI